MNDVERVFRHLVDVLSAREPGLLQEPLEVADLYQNIIPYRAHRAALRFDTNQDYEMALLRLLAGEHGLAEMEPGEAREQLAQEIRSANPNPGKFREHGGARVRLNFSAVREALAAHEAYAPPAVAPQRERWQDPRKQLAGPAARPSAQRSPLPAASHCPQCEGALPAGRPVVFCPFCGGNVNVRGCPQCGSELEASWRHCVTCGYRVSG